MLSNFGGCLVESVQILDNTGRADGLATTVAQIQQYLILDIYYNQFVQYLKDRFDRVDWGICYTGICTID
jgi:hypothetical protein